MEDKLEMSSACNFFVVHVGTEGFFSEWHCLEDMCAFFTFFILNTLVSWKETVASGSL